LIDGAAHISKCAAPFCFGYLKLRDAFDEKGLMVRHDFEESDLMVRHDFEESDLMVRHTPAFFFVHRFAIGTATGSSFSPLGEGWPKAGVCRTIEQANAGVCCTVEPCTSTLHINSCCTAKTFSLIRTCFFVGEMPIHYQ
jgi:hypothetical protein